MYKVIVYRHHSSIHHGPFGTRERAEQFLIGLAAAGVLAKRADEYHEPRAAVVEVEDEEE